MYPRVTMGMQQWHCLSTNLGWKTNSLLLPPSPSVRHVAGLATPCDHHTLTMSHQRYTSVCGLELLHTDHVHHTHTHLHVHEQWRRKMLWGGDVEGGKLHDDGKRSWHSCLLSVFVERAPLTLLPPRSTPCPRAHTIHITKTYIIHPYENEFAYTQTRHKKENRQTNGWQTFFSSKDNMFCSAILQDHCSLHFLQ